MVNLLRIREYTLRCKDIVLYMFSSKTILHKFSDLTGQPVGFPILYTFSPYVETNNHRYVTQSHWSDPDWSQSFYTDQFLIFFVIENFYIWKKVDRDYSRNEKYNPEGRRVTHFNLWDVLRVLFRSIVFWVYNPRVLFGSMVTIGFVLGEQEVEWDRYGVRDGETYT